MEFKKRIGVDLGRRLPAEDGIARAAANDVHYVDCRIDIAPNLYARSDEPTCAT